MTKENGSLWNDHFKQGTNARFQILIGGKVYNLPFSCKQC